MKHVTLDIMVNDKFYCSTKWSFNPLFVINLNEVENEILERLPSLRGRDYKILFPEEFGFKRS